MWLGSGTVQYAPMEFIDLNHSGILNDNVVWFLFDEHGFGINDVYGSERSGGSGGSEQHGCGGKVRYSIIAYNLPILPNVLSILVMTFFCLCIWLGNTHASLYPPEASLGTGWSED